MNHRLSRVCGILLLGLLVRPLAGQDPRLVERFPPDVVRRLSAVIDSTAHEGLPTEALVLRALEGNAKGATVDRIVAALARLHVALRTARATIGPQAAVTELTTAASALEAGVPAASLVELHRLRGGETLTAPLSAYLDLVARGAAPARAWDRIADLARHRADDAAYGKLSPTDVEHDPPPPTPPGPSTADAPDGAWTLSTSGGTGQLDHLAGGSISAFGWSLRQPIGGFRVRYDGATADHSGLGVTGAMSGDIRFAFSRGSWQVDAGPTFASGRDIGTAWRNAAGVLSQVTRTMGRWSISATLRGGIAWPGNGRALWAGHGVGAAVRVGDFRFGASWQGTTSQDSVVTSTALIVDTVAAPIDSVPYPTGGIIVRHRYDTTYQQRTRDLNDLALATSWGKGPLALQARVGRRLGIGQPGETWWALGGTVRLTATVGLTFSSRRTSSDPLLHLRGEQATTIGLRLSTPRHLPRLPSEPMPSSAVAIDRLPAGGYHLVFAVPGARRRVALAGDVTGWNTTALTRRADGRWEIVLPAEPGVYRINLREDDGPWRTPPGLPSTDDGFGGRVGLLVLER